MRTFHLQITTLLYCFVWFSESLVAQDNYSLDSAKTYFSSGDFSKSLEILEQPQTKDLESRDAILLRAQNLLLANRLDYCYELLKSHLTINPNDTSAIKLLIEALYRKDRFEELLPMLKRLGNQSRVEQLTHITNQEIPPNYFKRDFKQVNLRLETIDFLPSVVVTINGKEYLFIIDTGAGETIIDTDVAEEVEIKVFGETEGIYAAGKKAKFQYGVLRDLSLGELEIKNLPVHIQSTKQYSPAVGGKVVSGILGTTLLYHFNVILDYKNGYLKLYQRGLPFNSDQEKMVPFWLGADHLILARGSINNSPDQLFIVDNGMAGAGFTSPFSTLKDADIKLNLEGSFEGQGGGGTVSVTPFSINELSLGPIKSKGPIIGLYGAFPESLEYSQGYRIGGLISHSFFRPYSVFLDFDKMNLSVKE